MHKGASQSKAKYSPFSSYIVKDTDFELNRKQKDDK